MSKPQTTTNPFYILLLIVGVAFAITACAYGVMIVQSMKPLPISSPLLTWLQQWGTIALSVELGLLAICMFGAFATDSYWAKK